MFIDPELDTLGHVKMLERVKFLILLWECNIKINIVKKLITFAEIKKDCFYLSENSFLLNFNILFVPREHNFSTISVNNYICYRLFTNITNLWFLQVQEKLDPKLTPGSFLTLSVRNGPSVSFGINIPWNYITFQLTNK